MHSPRRLVTAIWFSVATLALSATGAKPNPRAEARQHYSAGMASFNLEDYDAAIKEFEAAYRLVPDPPFLFNIAQSHRLAKRPEKALGFYRRYLGQMAEAPNRADVERTIAALEKELAKAAPAPPPTVVKAPPAVPVVEPESSTAYLSNLVVDDKLYSLVGAGLRKVWGVKVYGMALYVEDAPGREQMAKLAARAGGRDLAHLTVDDQAQSWLLLGDFGRIGVLKFLRDVAAKDVQKAYRDSLAEELKPPTPDSQRAIDRFVALFARDMKKGDDCTIYTSAAGAISVETGGRRVAGPTDPRLAQAIWNIWLGKRPISTDLRKQLVNRIDALAR